MISSVRSPMHETGANGRSMKSRSVSLLKSALLLTLMQRALRPRILAYFNLRVVNMRQHLGLIAQVEQRSADRAFVEMIGLGSTGLKRINLELGKLHGLRERPVPCTARPKRLTRCLAGACCFAFIVSASLAHQVAPQSHFSVLPWKKFR